jgi:site-specific DNA-adenine methylase
MKLRPFWRYYGGKFRLAPHYPKPTHATIIEPFAGAAGYSLRYHDRQIVLVEKNPVIAELWRFLIGTTPEEVRSIPYVEHVDELPGWVPAGARSLVGFAMNSATTMPRKSLSVGKRKLASGFYGSKSARKFEGWTDAHKESVAAQIQMIRHWQIIEGDYSNAPNVEATWFVDPPYQKAGKYYPSKAGDYQVLGAWCRSLRGQVIVCENNGADWLPFEPFRAAKSACRAGATNLEAVWYKIQ